MNEALELLSADLLRSNCMQPFPKHVYQRFRLCALIDLERTRTTGRNDGPDRFAKQELETHKNFEKF